jgi:FkbM family methyltransferase
LPTRARRALREFVLAQAQGRQAPSFTARYEGPDWQYRRRRVLERLGIDLVIDVGANLGQYGMDLRAAEYAGRIASVEPSAEQFTRLAARAAADPWWEVHRMALGAQPGEVTLNVADNQGSASSVLPSRGLEFGTTAQMRYVGTEVVQMETLEDVGPRIAGDARRILLKADVQGLELDVIRGAGEFLSRVVAMELELSLLALYEGQPEWRAVVGTLEELGFTLFALDPGYSDFDSGRLVEMDGLFVRHALAEIGRLGQAADTGVS